MNNLRVSSKKMAMALMMGASITVLSGCQTLRKADTTDACYQYVQPLHNTQNIVQNSTVGGAVGGAVVGGILGALIGGDATSAVIGAAIGGGTGAIVGNQYGQQKSAEQKQALVRELDQKARQQSDAVGYAFGTISQLTQCRRNQVADIEQLSNSGAISKTEAKSRLINVQNRVASDNRLIAEIVGDASNRLNDYIKVGAEQGIDKDVLVGENDYSKWTPPEELINRSSSKSQTVKTGSRVRSGPSTSSSVLGSLAPGDKIVSNGSTADGKWTRFKYKGEVAYIYSELLGTPAQGGSKVNSTSSLAEWKMPEPENKVQELAQNTAKIKAAEQEHKAIDNDINQLFAALDA